MPKYYCDYCDIFLTHDSSAVRKAHNTGWKHINQVAAYYRELDQDKTQEIINNITEAYGGQPPPMPMPASRPSYSDDGGRYGGYQGGRSGGYGGRRSGGPYGDSRGGGPRYGDSRRNERRDHSRGRNGGRGYDRSPRDGPMSGGGRSFGGRYDQPPQMPPPNMPFPPPGMPPPPMPYGGAPGQALSAPPQIHDRNRGYGRQ
ncbi:U1 small nuclear ribonucleoprotein C [Coemansia sp. RSA 2711]|nr:U1 small nuclear ribonucleoprotein C [Coemansia sp. RSA 2711]KAJ2315093.1 U1 small nuclear ribonucleoprotein C [Coemansia sp. RSA 2705]KAJ2316759.1 U1 small nuclear ribonucleoprotein C [Coemansia sp. RSA 2704]KAJ2369351.1 U1 small nuclear ribonucleoprotein C [Coemansia sp. RSA 2610]KAJ2385037.1 U1 small nuclear ribonucleoprotein C [Coemansia sp. RSA 2611]KAJ2735758.1 U1 small nuclear ribonucleoprotein C [Coemansia sp. Cherry 401B]